MTTFPLLNLFYRYYEHPIPEKWFSFVYAQRVHRCASNSDQVVLPERSQTRTVLRFGQVQGRRVGNVVADAADLAPQQLAPVAHVADTGLRFNVVCDVRLATKNSTLAVNGIQTVVGRLQEQRTVVVVNGTVDKWLGNSIQQDTVKLLLILNQKLKTIVDTGVSVKLIANLQGSFLGGLVNVRIERRVKTVQSSFVKSYCERFSDLLAHNVDVVLWVSTDNLGRHSEDCSNL